MGIFSDILLTVDFDRTLTAPDSTIPERNLEAIRYFTENGGAFTVNTGRSIPMCHTIWDIPVNVPLLLYNGSAACDSRTRELSLCRPIELPRREVLEHLQSRYPKLTVEVQGVDAHYILRKDTGWEAYCDNNHCPWAYKEPEEIPGPFLKFSFYGEFRENTVASMYTGPAEEIQMPRVPAKSPPPGHCRKLWGGRSWCALVMRIMIFPCSPVPTTPTARLTESLLTDSPTSAPAVKAPLLT